METLTVLNTAVGIMSLVLGGFAIWLSFQFYSKATEAETRTAVTLEAIRAQSEALQKLTGRWMDRFTRHATEPKPADEGLLALVNAMANLPTTILTHLRVYSEPRGTETTEEIKEAAIAEMVNCYVCLYHYTALANISWQALLPADGIVDETDAVQLFLIQTVDSTAKDFAYMANILAKIDNSRLRACSYVNLLDYTIDHLRDHIADSASILAARQGRGPAEQGA